MRKLSLLSFFVIASTLSIAAQQPNTTMLPPTASAAATSITVMGCVVGLNGGYSLDAGNGKTFLLAGDNISQHSGQKVRALGNVKPAAKTGTNSNTQPTLTVTRIDKLADTCSASH